jgi:hypothetical protein
MRQTIIFVENHTMKKNLFALLVCMAPSCVLAQLPSYLPTDGLVGWWPFNGNANDESGNGNNGTVNGATLTSDRFGIPLNAYQFNSGSNLICTSNTFNTPNVLTYSVWMNSSNIGFLMGFNNGQCYHGFNWDRTIIIDGTNQFRFYTFPGTQVSTTASVNIINSQWNHVVITMDESGSKIYVNGELIISNPSQTVGENFIGYFRFGGLSPNDLNNSVVGSLDDIGIWNRALSPEEITALYTATPTNGGGGNNTTSANVPQGISYQAVARNPQGQPLTNTALQVKFTLLSDSLTGTTEYAELHSLTTNDLGLFTTAFGTGTPLSGTFANINWASGNKYLKVEMDAVGGFIALGTQQMLSVPYSMRSQTSATIQNNALPVYSDNAAALAGGLQAGQMYRTAAGVLMVVY